MKKFLFISIVISIFFTGIYMGCGKKEETKKTEKKTTIEDVKKEAKEALNATASYAAQKKREYQKKIEDKIKKLDNKIDELEKKASQLKDQSKVALERDIETLRNQQKVLKEKLKKWESTSGKAWEDLKGGIDTALDKIEKSYDKAISKLKK